MTEHDQHHSDHPDADLDDGPRQAEPEQEPDTGNAEAARYRRRLRETEQERDALREQVHAFRKSEVERQVSDALETPSDLWLTGVELGELVDEDGQLDESKIDETVLATTTEHPAWRKRPDGVDHDQGMTSSSATTPSWSKLLRETG